MPQHKFTRRNWLRSMLMAPPAIVGLNALSSTAKAAPISPNDKIIVS
ncbi:MAG: hypothetical protein O7C75_02970 [Verrucomicrobia bacterium]|nr:hypothetical protein [Verrucomicrobiota bacterium]